MNLSKMFSTIDTHVAGEPFRIVTQSPIRLNERDVYANNERLQTSFASEKALLINEPRGHRGMTGCIVTSSRHADFSLFFFSHDGATFKYPGLAAALTALLETGNIRQNESGVYRVETVHGIYELNTSFINGEVKEVQFETDEVGPIEKMPVCEAVTVAGQRKYLVFPFTEEVPELTTTFISEVTRWGRTTVEEWHAAKEEFTGLILADFAAAQQGLARSVTFESDGSITRSAGVDSTIALFAVLRKSYPEMGWLENRSVFDEPIIAETLPEDEKRYSVLLRAIVTGTHEFLFDETDPLRDGFILT
ncbi:proline racemase family protein [Oceanobacillus indicireducens]|uniref:Proline racemase n=1 Tax=Oceanobacillus indicireducens TaxID=1004261 RepID=A0A917Y340_9BACI|nr:proline racemase family protein [Oceanobacillus indicireducens]GGN64121.1 proline racemase [Oceanobacillus indicireducens]